MNLLYCSGGVWFFDADPPHLAPTGRSQFHDYVMDDCNFAEYTAYITPRGLEYAD